MQKPNISVLQMVEPEKLKQPETMLLQSGQLKLQKKKVLTRYFGWMQEIINISRRLEL